MTGRHLFRLLLPLLALALMWRGHEVWGYWRASRILAAVEGASLAASRGGRLPPQIGSHHLRLLREAAALNPSQVDIVVARGWQYQLLGRPQAAIRAFEEALALEPRAEVYASLGQAHLAAGHRAEARQALERALLLAPRMRRELAGLLAQARQDEE